MKLAERIELMQKLGDYIVADGPQLKIVKEKAWQKNKWFTLQFVDMALENISRQYLNEEKLWAWTNTYHLDDNIIPRLTGIVMAGNIPLVGFHDFLSVFVSGHKQKIKLSDKDDRLLPYLIKKLIEWNEEVSTFVEFADRLKDCDAYIATGSNNSARYFNYYFGKYPSLVRSNKTSVSVLSGDENGDELDMLADDVHAFFGLGCRNTTRILVPEHYDFMPLLHSLKKYDYFTNHAKYKNNYDYNLALLIMNSQQYMSNGSIILYENESNFSPVSQLHFSYYTDKTEALNSLKHSPEIQAVYERSGRAFGSSQVPALGDYAEGVDTMQFLLSL